MGQIVGALIVVYVAAWILEKVLWRHVLDSPKQGLAISVLSAATLLSVIYIWNSYPEQRAGAVAYWIAAPIIIALRYWRESPKWDEPEVDEDLQDTFR